MSAALDDDVGPAAQAGLGQRGVDGARGEDRRDRQALERPGGVGQRRGPRRRAAAAATASAASRSSAAARPSGPVAGSQVASSVRTATGRRRRGPRRAARRGRRRSAAPGGRSAAPRGGPPRSAGRRPSSTRRSMTIRSRSGSIGGFVTWANAWRRWSATGRSSAAAAGRRRVVAHAPQRLVAFERHRLDVEPGTLGVEPGEVAQRRGRRRRPGRADASPTSTRSSCVGRGGVVDRQVAQDPGLRLGVLEDRAPARLDEQQLARARGGRAGPSRRRLNGTAPASEATATSRSRVTAKAAGRRPLRSTSAPTRRPSAKTMRRRAVPRREEPGRPAAERGDVRDAARGAGPSASGIAARSAGVEVPAGRRQQLEGLVERQRVGAVRREQRAGREERRAATSRVAPRRAARPRTCSRLPRTVLISPLWAIDRNGWASRQTGCVFVA